MDEQDTVPFSSKKGRLLPLPLARSKSPNRTGFFEMSCNDPEHRAVKQGHRLSRRIGGSLAEHLGEIAQAEAASAAFEQPGNVFCNSGPLTLGHSA